MRFLMNMKTIVVHPAPRLIDAFRQNLSEYAWALAAVFVPSAKPDSRHPRLLTRHNYSAHTFDPSQSCFSKLPLSQYTASGPPLLLFPPTSPTVLFPCVKQRQG